MGGKGKSKELKKNNPPRMSPREREARLRLQIAERKAEEQVERYSPSSHPYASVLLALGAGFVAGYYPPLRQALAKALKENSGPLVQVLSDNLPGLLGPTQRK